MVAAILVEAPPSLPNVLVESNDADGASALFTTVVDDIIFFLLGYVLLEVIRRLLGHKGTKGGKTKKHAEEDDCVSLKMDGRAHAKGAVGSTTARRGMLADEAQQVAQARAAEELFRADGCVDRALEALGRAPTVTPESIVPLLRECLRRKDAASACKVERFAREQNIPTSFEFYEFLLKLHALHGTPRAIAVFDNMVQDGFSASEGLCGNLLARCADARFSAFAEHVHLYLRSRSMATLATYKALIRVYGSCGLCERACDLYDQAKADGVHPDAVMSGCLVKFATKCGKVELSKEIIANSPTGSVQNYAWCILSAGKNGDVQGAFALLREMEARADLKYSDVTPYNHVLDVCVAAGDFTRARVLVDEIRAGGIANASTYNSMIRLCCAAHAPGSSMNACLAEVRVVLQEMEAAGHAADSMTYNIVVGALVASRCLESAWAIVDEMDRKGVGVDNYTVSILTKASKTAHSSWSLGRALALLDRPGVDVCADDVLLNTVLDACIGCRDFGRIAAVVDRASASHCSLSVHTYGLLIKACSVLQRPAQCKTLWAEMVDSRGLCPSEITLSCMMDALVRAEAVDDAIEVFRKWQSKVPPNAVIYSTLIKGYASKADAEGAMGIYREMREAGVPMNLISYTTLIDAQARGGDMEQAEELLAQMQREGCEPNTITFSTLMKGHCRAGDMTKAMEVFHEMKSRCLAFDAIIYNTLLDGCVRHSRFSLADWLLVEMREQGVVPTSFTLSTVIKMWGKRHQLDEAFAAMRTMPKEYGFQVDSQTGTCLVSACFYNNAHDRAMEALQLMKESRNGKPDANTYGTMIINFARRGFCQQGVDLAREACGLPCMPPAKGGFVRADAAKQLHQALQRRGLCDELGQPLQDELRAASTARGSRAAACANFLASFSGGHTCA